MREQWYTGHASRSGLLDAALRGKCRRCDSAAMTGFALAWRIGELQSACESTAQLHRELADRV